MRSLAAATAALAPAACSRTPPAPAPSQTPAPRITQFYSTTPQLAHGETGMLCYGVENAKTVWLSPPHRELSAALARCVEVAPTATTTYTLTAEGAGGSAKQELTIALGPPKVKIVEVWVNSLELAAGDQLELCYKVQNAAAVRVEPKIAMLTAKPNCGSARPPRTTTYTVTATGAGGEQDSEHVTVKVH
jgi:hypothetical protein